MIEIFIDKYNYIIFLDYLLANMDFFIKDRFKLGMSLQSLETTMLYI